MPQTAAQAPFSFSDEQQLFRETVRAFARSKFADSYHARATARGAAQRALDMTIEYVKERSAFGRTISHFQGVSFVLAEHDTRLELTRALGYRTIGLRMAGLPHTARPRC